MRGPIDFRFELRRLIHYRFGVADGRRIGEPLAPVRVVALRAPSRLAVLRPIHLVDPTRAPCESAKRLARARRDAAERLHMSISMTKGCLT